MLVVGGGISGIHAALTLGNAGKKVFLVEREPSIGGHMAKFDKTFPTLDCAACILTPKMSAVRSHENITLWTYSEVVKVEGYVGNYTVTVRRKPRYVHEELCVGCQECIKACVYKEPKFPDEFNVGLNKRKPIYIPFPQAVPQVVLIDPERCLQVKTGKCKKTCLEACADRQAIDFDQKEQLVEIKVGTIIVATGFKLFDAKRIPQYGYGLYPNVVTSLELERLVTSSGPTGGEIILRDGSKPKTAGFILCVGSRDLKTNRWCSRTCCMHSMKLAQLFKEHTDADVTIFYMDIRAPGKGCEEFYDKSLREGIRFVRGRVAEVTDWALAPEEEGKLVIRVEDTLAGFVRRIPVDMIVLAVGHGTASRRPGSAPAVQHELRLGRLVPGEASQTRAREHFHRRRVHRRLLPGAEGHPRQHRPGRRRRRRSAWRSSTRATSSRSPTPRTSSRRNARAANPASRSALTPPSRSTRRNRRRSSTRPCAKAAAPASPPARPARSSSTCSRTSRSSAKSKECWLIESESIRTKRIPRHPNRPSPPGSRESWLFSATGAPTPPPTWPASRA